MKSNRRQILKGLSLGAGATLLGPMIQNVMARSNGETGGPKRIVFVLQGNGFDAIQGCPETIPFKEYKNRNKFESINLKNHKLPASFTAMEPYKDKFTLIHGLSGRVTGGGHTVGGGALGQFKSSDANPVPQGITIDYQLGQKSSGILPWIGLGMNSKSASGSSLRWSARAAKKPVPILYSPEKAYSSYFGLVAGGKQEKDFHIKRNLLDYMVDDVKKAKKALGKTAGEELEYYLDAYDGLSNRQKLLLSSKSKLAKSRPKHDERFNSEDPMKRMEAHFELATSALIGGLTNVATLTCAAYELNNFSYRSLGIDKNNHAIGHMGGKERGKKGTPYYEKYRGWLFGVIANMVKRFESIPEGNGTMMDNTVIIYMSDAPDTHHSTAMEWPLAIVGNLKGKLNLGGKYISFPGYGKTGHRTVGSFYNTLLNSVGHRQATFGQIDRKLDLTKMQTGPIPELMV